VAFKAGFAMNVACSHSQVPVARLSHAFAMQMEAFRRLRNGGSQFVRVEHVHLDEGAQAVIGNLKQK
jgi:hypothetical protein